MKPTTIVIAATAAIIFSTGAGAAEKLGYPAHELLVTGEDVLGQPLTYPAGKPMITSAIVTIQPGAEGQLHRHQVPMYAYVLQGTVTVDYGAHGTRTFKTGEAILEAQHVPHKGMNKGTEPVALLVVYMGVEGLPNATAVK